MMSLENSRFTFKHSPSMGYPYRVVAHINGEPTIMSHRRSVTVESWCAEQFGHRQTIVGHQEILFAQESDMVLFITMMSGADIAPASLDEVNLSNNRKPATSSTSRASFTDYLGDPDQF